MSPTIRQWFDREMTITYLFAGIPVSNRDASAQWYSNLFASEPMYPNDDEAMWQLVGSGSLYVIVSSDAGAGTVTLIVDDLDECQALLSAAHDRDAS